MTGLLKTWIDNIAVSNKDIIVQGWIVHSTERIMSISVYKGDTPLIAHLELGPRQDIEAHFPNFPYALYSSFKFQVPCPPGLLDVSYFPFRIIAYLANGETAIINASYVDVQRETRHLPAPPSHLMKRVRGFDSAWLQAGAIIYYSMKAAIEKHRQLTECGRILDWGCGCANVLRYLTYDIPGRRIYGCDIDSEAITWDRKFIEGPTFRTNEYVPPIPFADQYFDLIYGSSVFTHLNEGMQFKRLPELQRLRAPAGMDAFSIHSESIMTLEIKELINKTNGLLDIDSSQQAEFAPFSTESYYRMTYHTKAYILREWSKYLRIVDYVERT